LKKKKHLYNRDKINNRLLDSERMCVQFFQVGQLLFNFLFGKERGFRHHRVYLTRVNIGWCIVMNLTTIQTK